MIHEKEKKLLRKAKKRTDTDADLSNRIYFKLRFPNILRQEWYLGQKKKNRTQLSEEWLRKGLGFGVKFFGVFFLSGEMLTHHF